MASEREQWIDGELDDEQEDQPSQAVAADEDDDDDVELHGQFFE
jgi:hypothetical protein